MSDETGGYVADVMRKRLVEEWDPSEAFGYDPTVPYDHEDYLSIHTGAYDDKLGFPQIAISEVSSGFLQGTPIHGFKADGSGVVTGTRSFMDINCWAGTEDHVGTDPDPDEIASKMAHHVRDIVHTNHQWLLDPDTGERVAENVLPAGEPMTGADPEAMAYWRSLLEVSFDKRHDPPSGD